MSIQDKVINILQYQARINFLLGKRDEIDRDIADENENLDKAKKEKSSAISLKEKTIQELEFLQSSVDAAMRNVDNAKLALEETESAFENKKIFFDSLPDLDDSEIEVITLKTDKLFKDKDTLNLEIADNQNKIDELQSELRDEGYEFSIKGNSSATNIVL